MKTIVRYYLLKELTIPLVLWLAFLFLLLFLMQFLRGADVLLGSAVTPADIGRLASFISPHFIVMSIPIALLLAILLGLGRLGEDREIIALQALGVSPWQILTVPLLLGTALGAITLALASSVEPWGFAPSMKS